MSAASPTRRLSLLALLVTAAVVFALDHLTKWLVTRRIALGEQVPSSGPVTLHHVQNRGAAFSILPNAQWLFLIVAVAVSAYILLAGHRFGRGLTTQVVLGLVLGGAVANAVDRVVNGYVVDFVDFHIWPVFNLGDSCIVVGILAIVLVVGVERREPDRAP